MAATVQKNETLKAAVEREGAQPSPAAPGAAPQPEQEEESAPPVNLRQRAYPLIGLLETAAREKEDVTWAPARIGCTISKIRTFCARCGEGRNNVA